MCWPGSCLFAFQHRKCHRTQLPSTPRGRRKGLMLGHNFPALQRVETESFHLLSKWNRLPSPWALGLSCPAGFLPVFVVQVPTQRSQSKPFFCPHFLGRQTQVPMLCIERGNRRLTGFAIVKQGDTEQTHAHVHTRAHKHTCKHGHAHARAHMRT